MRFMCLPNKFRSAKTMSTKYANFWLHVYDKGFHTLQEQILLSLLALLALCHINQYRLMKDCLICRLKIYYSKKFGLNELKYINSCISNLTNCA